MNDIEKLEREIQFWENASEHSQEDWLRALAWCEYTIKSSGRLFSDFEKTSTLISKLSCFLVASECIDLKKIKYIRYIEEKRQLDVYDALGRNVFAPFWVESDDPDFRVFVNPAVYSRRKYAINHFGGLGLSSRRVDKELSEKFKQLSSASRTILGKSSSFELLTKNTIRHSLAKLRKDLMGYMPNEYQDVPLATSILEDRITQEILRVGEMEKDHPGVLAFLHESTP